MNNRLISTRGRDVNTIDEAIQSGLAKDGGLYVPQQFPQYSFMIDTDSQTVINKWQEYWNNTKNEATALGKNCAVAAQWFLTQFANIPEPNHSNISLNHAFLGLVWPSFIPSPASLPGRIMSNAKFYLDARNHPEIANYYSKLFLQGCLLASSTAFMASSTNISSNNSTATNGVLAVTAGVSSYVFFKSWNFLSAQKIAEETKKAGITPGEALMTVGQAVSN